MKKYLLLVITVCIVHVGSGQTRWIAVTGMSTSSFTNDLMALYGFEDYRAAYLDAGGTASSAATNSIKVNGYIGMECDIKLAEKTFLKTGLKYLSVGDSYFFTTKDVQYQDSYGKSDGRYIWRPRLDYLAVPLNYGIRQSDVLTLYAGITPHFNLDNLLRYSYYSGSGDDVEQKWERIDGPVDAKKMVLFANVGASYYLSQRSLLDLRIHRSLGSVYDDAEVANTFNETGAWSVEIGFGLVLGSNSRIEEK